jgi:hypothetical protein
MGDRTCHTNYGPLRPHMALVYSQNMMQEHPPIGLYRFQSRNCVCDATCMCENVNMTDQGASCVTSSCPLTTICFNMESTPRTPLAPTRASVLLSMPHKRPHTPICTSYSRVHKQLVIYQFHTLGRTTTQITIDLKMSLRRVQRVIHMWNKIGEMCQDRKYKEHTPLMSAAAINVCGCSLLLYAIC